MIWWNYCYAPTIQKFSFNQVKSRGTLTVPTGAEGYEEWMNLVTWATRSGRFSTPTTCNTDEIH